MRAAVTVWITILALGWSAPLLACSGPPAAPMTAGQVRDFARAQFTRAALVVDAEVEMPMNPHAGPGLMPLASLRVLATYKGKPNAVGWISIVAPSSCDIQLLKKGERVRILLLGGPDFYHALLTMHGPNTLSDGADTAFNAEIDRLAGAPRPAGFSAEPGKLKSISQITYRDEPNIVSLGPVKALAAQADRRKEAALIGVGAGLLIFFGLVIVSSILRRRKEKA